MVYNDLLYSFPKIFDTEKTNADVENILRNFWTAIAPNTIDEISYTGARRILDTYKLTMLETYIPIMDGEPTNMFESIIPNDYACIIPLLFLQYNIRFSETDASELDTDLEVKLSYVGDVISDKIGDLGLTAKGNFGLEDLTAQTRHELAATFKENIPNLFFKGPDYPIPEGLDFLLVKLDIPEASIDFFENHKELLENINESLINECRYLQSLLEYGDYRDGYNDDRYDSRNTGRNDGRYDDRNDNYRGDSRDSGRTDGRDNGRNAKPDLNMGITIPATSLRLRSSVVNVRVLDVILANDGYGNIEGLYDKFPEYRDFVQALRISISIVWNSCTDRESRKFMISGISRIISISAESDLYCMLQGREYKFRDSDWNMNNLKRLYLEITNTFEENSESESENNTAYNNGRNNSNNGNSGNNNDARTGNNGNYNNNTSNSDRSAARTPTRDTVRNAASKYTAASTTALSGLLKRAGEYSSNSDENSVLNTSSTGFYNKTPNSNRDDNKNFRFDRNDNRTSSSNRDGDKNPNSNRDGDKNPNSNKDRDPRWNDPTDNRQKWRN